MDDPKNKELHEKNLIKKFYERFDEKKREKKKEWGVVDNYRTLIHEMRNIIAEFINEDKKN